MLILTRAIDFFTSILASIAGIAVALLMVHVTADVIARAVLRSTFPGTIIVVSNYYMIFLVCLPLAFVERRDAHISVDVATNLMPKRVTLPLFGWTYLFTAVVFGLVAYGSWVEAMVQYRAGKFALEQGISFPTWIGYFSVPLGYGMGTIYAILKFVRFLIGRPPRAEADDVRHHLEKLGHD
jgi:TRAP-type C4-dicarboxylate transport system permease small subunit